MRIELSTENHDAEFQKQTQKIQEALDLCEKAGGGQVILKEGTFISGTLYMRNHVYLEIQQGAKLLASGDIRDYGKDTHHNRYRNETSLDRCFLYGEDICDAGITGFGIIDGNADCFPNDGDIYRPMLIRMLRCKNIHLKEIRLYNAAAWTCAFLDSSYIWADSVDIRNEKKYNGDGLDFDGCSHVYVSNCNIRGTDDNLCLQASSPQYPVSDIHITNCSFSSICAAIRIGLKSIGNISNVVISNCTMNQVWREGIKLECTEGGNISDICISNIQMKNVRRPIFLLLNNRFEPEDYGSSLELAKMPPIGTLSRIFITDLHAADDEEMRNPHYRFQDDCMGRPEFAGIRVDANRNHPIQTLALRNVHYRFIGGVHQSDIPKDYPEVEDKQLNPNSRSSENYYPDWSRTAFMDIRNVHGLSLDGVYLEAVYPDERIPVLTEGCRILKKELFVEQERK
ncbi:MAG: glycosyl hydrolase family 28 protein [bacterium]|nr:glycosyl hydrolase family 28 protein [bacterium]